MTVRLWFAGTPPFAAYSLLRLVADSRYQVDAVLTRADKPTGRGRKLTASAVKTIALDNNIPLAQPKVLREAEVFPDFPRPDIVVVAAYGLLLPQWFLNYPAFGCINIHASLLPRWRGAAPIQRAIEEGDTETGISIMQIDAGLDTGPVWLQRHCAILPDTTGETLTQTLTLLGAEALLEALPIILSATKTPTQQGENNVTYAKKLSKAEAQINWQTSVALIERKIRAFNPTPMAFTLLNKTPIRLYQASVLNSTISANPGQIIAHTKLGIDVAAADGLLRIHTLQFPGKRAMTAGEILNGRCLTGQCFL